MKKSVLVIDDDQVVIRTVERYLKTCEYHVEIAQSGREAVKKMKRSNFELIIADIRMPGMGDLATLKRIRESNLDKEKIPAVIITGYAGDDDSCKKAEKLGIVECIYKPFDLEEFIAVIRRNLGLPPKYKRTNLRIEVAFPVEVKIKDPSYIYTKTINGETVDLSEAGIGVILDSLLPQTSKVSICVNAVPHYEPFQAQASIVWSRSFFKNGYFRAGLHFLKIEDEHLPILKKILKDHESLDKNFVFLLKEIQQFLQDVKGKFDNFDKVNKNQQKQIDFIETNKKEIFTKLDTYFNKVWAIIKDFERDKYIVHQSYYQRVLGYLLLELIETNRHVYQKPLGYPGDFIMMNYIYDYHKGNYLGNSAYEKLINNYTCNIPISCSNIRRKDFLKKIIIEALEKSSDTKILSFACGPARELLELLREGKINKLLVFKCLDPEKKALDYISTEINKIELSKKMMLSIEYLYRDIASIIRDKNLKKSLQGQDLIYAFGIFDYLSEKMASRLTKELYELLQYGGKLVIFNASSKNNSYRAYYELLGEWNMVHRTEEQMLSWTKDIGNTAEIKFEDLFKGNSYLCLSIAK